MTPLQVTLPLAQPATKPAYASSCLVSSTKISLVTLLPSTPFLPLPLATDIQILCNQPCSSQTSLTTNVISTKFATKSSAAHHLCAFWLWERSTCTYIGACLQIITFILTLTRGELYKHNVYAIRKVVCNCKKQNMHPAAVSSLNPNFELGTALQSNTYNVIDLYEIQKGYKNILITVTRTVKQAYSVNYFTKKQFQYETFTMLFSKKSSASFCIGSYAIWKCLQHPSQFWVPLSLSVWALNYEARALLSIGTVLAVCALNFTNMLSITISSTV